MGTTGSAFVVRPNGLLMIHRDPKLVDGQHALKDLPGLDDGVFYMPASDSGTERLCLIYSGPSLDRATIERWLRTRLDAAFVPRTLICVDRLPRGDNGKLSRLALDSVYAQWRDGKGAA